MHALGCADRLYPCDGNAALAMRAFDPRPRHALPATLADAWRDVRGIADALGVPERGVQLVTQLRGRLRAIGERAATRPRRRVAVLVTISPPRVAGRWLPELVELAGATDAFGCVGGEPTRVTEAALAAADPDAVFFAPRGFDLARVRAAVAARARAPWRGLRALREGMVFLADGSACFHASGPRLTLTLEVLAEALHPDAFRFGHAGTLWERLQPPLRG